MISVPPTLKYSLSACMYTHRYSRESPFSRGTKKPPFSFASTWALKTHWPWKTPPSMRAIDSSCSFKTLEGRGREGKGRRKEGEKTEEGKRREE